MYGLTIDFFSAIPKKNVSSAVISPEIFPEDKRRDDSKRIGRKEMGNTHDAPMVVLLFCRREPRRVVFDIGWRSSLFNDLTSLAISCRIELSRST